MESVMNPTFVTVLLLILVLLAGVGVAILVSLHRNAGNPDRMRELLRSDQQEVIGNKFQDHERHLTEVIDARLHRQEQKSSETLNNLMKEIGQISAAQKNITDLSSKVTDLSTVLSNSQQRGQFGEIQLGNIIKDSLPRDLYEFQATLKNQDGRSVRVDCILKLPEPTGNLSVDSKFPTQGFRELKDAKLDDVERASARDKFEKAVIKHLEDIGQKYIIPGATADLALMFVASEAIIAEITNLRKVLDKSNALRVYIVGPSTLMAAVATIRSLYNDARIAEEAEVIRTVLGKLGEDMERLDKRVNNLRSHFDAMQTDVHQISVSSGKIQKTIDRIQAPEEVEKLSAS